MDWCCAADSGFLLLLLHLHAICKLQIGLCRMPDL